MPRTNPLTALLAMAATVLMFNPAFAQHCDSCAAGGAVQGGFAPVQFQGGFGADHFQGGYTGAQFQGGQFGGECASCQAAGFDYPASGGCGAGGCVGKVAGYKANLKAWYDHIHHINDVAIARNRAWPKPFQCADRQQYFAIWQPMLQAGVNANCLLSNHHFDKKTGELNAGGKTRLRTIAQNNPVGQKAILIQNTGDQMVNNQRMTYVQQIINDFYGQESFAQVAVSNSFPVGGSGARTELVNQLHAEQGIALPVIPVEAASASAQQAIGGN